MRKCPVCNEYNFTIFEPVNLFRREKLLCPICKTKFQAGELWILINDVVTGGFLPFSIIISFLLLGFVIGGISVTIGYVLYLGIFSNIVSMKKI